MSDSIRVSNGTKHIEVNDNGEYITLALGDQMFLNRILDLLDEFNGIQQDTKDRGAQIEAMPEDTAEQQMVKMRAMADINLETHQRLKNRLDEVIGPDTCRKVFGDIVPAMEMYADFFEKLLPFIEKYAQERGKKISKYSPKRKGNT